MLSCWHCNQSLTVKWRHLSPFFLWFLPQRRQKRHSFPLKMNPLIHCYFRNLFKKKKNCCLFCFFGGTSLWLSLQILTFLHDSVKSMSFPNHLFFHILIVKFIQISTYQPIMGLLNSVRTVVDLLLRKTRTEHLTGDIRYNKQVIRFNVLWSSVYVSMNNFKETALFFS